MAKAKKTAVKSPKKGKGAKKERVKKVSYHVQPEELSLRQWQIALRKQFGHDQAFVLHNEGDHPVWSDFTVSNPGSGASYRIALRSPEPGHNFCACFDFKVSGLQTCKHIEWALHTLSNKRGNKQYFRKPAPPRAYSSVYLHYGEKRSLRIRIGTNQSEAIEELAKAFFDQEGIFYEHAYLDFERFLSQARAIQPEFRCYPDALEWVLQRRADERRAKHAQQIADREGGLNGLIKAELYPYQRAGVLFAFKAGRALLADEMGLGKTIQAIAAAELYRREYGISNILIVCPTSLKYQWQSEIQQFTDVPVHVIEGSIAGRHKQYTNPDFVYKIITYNVVVRDLEVINAAAPDLIILDEAQRIKNWDTKIARAVKQLQSPYRLALTGTPLENKLEDLYSIVQFLDQFLMGPLYLLLHRHQVRQENGMVTGYRNLNEIYDKLKNVMLRRRKRDVLKQLPKRVDKNLLVPMTKEQMDMHRSYETDLAQLVAKWRRFHFLNEQDRLKLMSLLQLMRMACDSTYIVDQNRRFDTKVDELFYILEEYLAEPEHKVVIFSQWQRMTQLIEDELKEKGIGCAHLHGGVPSIKRGEMLERFNQDEECRVFLSTDAGGVGLNLQKASLVVNMDLPWNPAVLEQRIARAYRLGQERSVQVVNLISRGTIEHRMLGTLQFKSSLASAVLDNAEDSVFVDDKRFKDFMERLETIGFSTTSEEEVFQNEAVADVEENLERPNAAQHEILPPQTWLEEALSEEEEEALATADEDGVSAAPAGLEKGPEPKPRPQRDLQPAVETAAPAGKSGPVRSAADAQDMVSQGLSFLGRLGETLKDERATRQLVEAIVQKDEATGETFLKIPVESAAVVQNAIQLLGSLFANKPG